MTRPRHSRVAGMRAREMRQDMPLAEVLLWIELRKKKVGARFRRQVPIGIYIVDFAAMIPKLALEIDGPSHEGVDESKRTAYINARGFPILRFDNEDVLEDIDWVIERIAYWVAHLKAFGVPPE